MFSFLSLLGAALGIGSPFLLPSPAIELSSRGGPNFVFHAYGRRRFWESADRLKDFYPQWEEKYVARTSDGNDCGVTADGTVECWTISWNGSEPIQKDLQSLGNVPGPVKQFERGCLRTQDDQVYCRKATATPEGYAYRFVKVDTSRLGAGIVQMVGSQTHACLLTTKGKIFCWGSDWAGKLGLGGLAIVQRQDRFQDDDGAYSLTEARPPVAFPVRPILTNPSLEFTFVSTLAHTSCGLSSETADNLYCWGLLSSFSIGIDEAMGENNRAVSATPKRLDLSSVPGRRFEGVATGNSYGCGWTESNQVFCWGTVEPIRDTEDELALKLTPIDTRVLRWPIRALVTIGYRVCAITRGTATEPEQFFCTHFVSDTNGRTVAAFKAIPILP